MIGHAIERAGRQRHGAGGTGSVAGTDSERLARHAGQDLEWVRPAWWRCTWELRAGGDTLLVLEPENWWCTSTVAELDGERIVYGRSSWRDTAIRARDGAEVGRLHRIGLRHDEDSERLGLSRWWGAGRLEVAGSRAWLRRTPWTSRWTLLDEKERELATLACRNFGLFARGSLRIAPRGAERPALALLVTLAWWIIEREQAHYSHVHLAH